MVGRNGSKWREQEPERELEELGKSCIVPSDVLLQQGSIT